MYPELNQHSNKNMQMLQIYELFFPFFQQFLKLKMIHVLIIDVLKDF